MVQVFWPGRPSPKTKSSTHTYYVCVGPPKNKGPPKIFWFGIEKLKKPKGHNLCFARNLFLPKMSFTVGDYVNALSKSAANPPLPHPSIKAVDTIYVSNQRFGILYIIMDENHRSLRSDKQEGSFEFVYGLWSGLQIMAEDSNKTIITFF